MYAIRSYYESPFNPSFVDLKFFDENGLNLPMSAEKSAELLFFREDFVRASYNFV